ncbi:MAG: FecR family protein [Prosthecobacter sp.]|nr:FecR family protein [Prosthecobacter sp.]
MLTLLYASGSSSMQAQTVVNVSQVLPFAASGTVTSGATTVKTGETSITSSPGSAMVPANTPGLAMAGGKISTGADGAASLVLGAGAEVGTARLGSDSEVKVPDAGEKGHSLEMLKGQLFLNISADQLKQRGNSEFKLKTPAALLAVKGTKFFSSSKDGKDTIGVHEGSVEVVEPTTGQKLTLAAGQAVEVSPGILEAMREMTVDEKQLVPEYDKARIARMSCGVYAEGQNQYYYQGTKVADKDLPPIRNAKGYRSLQDDRRPWLHWKDARGETQAGSLFAPKPHITEQGTVRYVWNARTMSGSDKAELARMSCGSAVGRENRRSWQRLVAVEFQMRILRLESIDMALNLDMGSYGGISVPGRDRITGAQLPPDGSWISVTLPVRRSLVQSKGDLYPSLVLEVIPSLPDKLSQNASAIELRDFTLLFQP